MLEVNSNFLWSVNLNGVLSRISGGTFKTSLANSNVSLKVGDILAHGLSIKVSAQGLLTEQNNGKGIVATDQNQEGASESTHRILGV